ncbi:MAG: Unknown protein [uncultured Thiotrichaceae bacterium]|uniref:DUF1127 domain-containing protein n=1 Tax=uncultured Thiotrichaceae bacterium TaxID=298394 RepID=A0A6S6SNY8_9GAMM|nr:MAG: Unknown protein [uncultured Thiotrichaceae bacterium]
MSILKTITSFVKNMIDTHQKSQVMRVLMDMSNKQLEDIGVSRYQLERGVKAYPWHDAAEQPKQSMPAAQVLPFQHLIATPSTLIMGSAANESGTKQAA